MKGRKTLKNLYPIRILIIKKTIPPIFMDSILLDIKSKLTDLIPNSSRKGVFRSVWMKLLSTTTKISVLSNNIFFFSTSF